MAELNLAQEMKALPADLLAALQEVKKAAKESGAGLFLVGGTVRDLLLKRPTGDIDLAVQGDAIALLKETRLEMTRKTIHPAFGTARLELNGFCLDLATVRAEDYAHPGALPTVRPGTLKEDLFRRDFSVNSLAVSLNEDDYGQLIDPYHGLEDLRDGIIRVLHAHSFIDDPTRIWRAARYEQRLGFKIEPNTLRLIRRDAHGLVNISGDRVWYELDCVFNEEEPERALTRLAELGVLGQLQPSLKADDWLTDRFQQARELCRPQRPSTALYLAVLTFKLNGPECTALSEYLHLSKEPAQVLIDTQAVKMILTELSRPGKARSRIYALLHPYAVEAITAAEIAAENARIVTYLRLYRSELCRIHPVLNGDDLKAMGLKPGPQIKELLYMLLNARLDGRVIDRLDEVNLAEAEIARLRGLQR